MSIKSIAISKLAVYNKPTDWGVAFWVLVVPLSDGVVKVEVGKALIPAALIHMKLSEWGKRCAYKRRSICISDMW